MTDMGDGGNDRARVGLAERRPPNGAGVHGAALRCQGGFRRWDMPAGKQHGVRCASKTEAVRLGEGKHGPRRPCVGAL